MYMPDWSYAKNTVGLSVLWFAHLSSSLRIVTLIQRL